jgi:hypothetical protein
MGRKRENERMRERVCLVCVFSVCVCVCLVCVCFVCVWEGENTIN